MESQAAPITAAVAVPVDRADAFDLFTIGMGKWWPLDLYSRAVNELADQAVEAVRLEFQPGLGGAIVEHLSDGGRLPWGEVVGWRPPERVVIAWKPHSEPEPPTNVEVDFAAGDPGTHVKVEHGGWERLTEGFRAGLYELYARGWPKTLDRFLDAAESIHRRR